MGRAWSRLTSWWAALPPHRRRVYNGLSLVLAVYLAHYLVFTIAQPFYIEDSAISFSFARSLVQGEGLVPFAGAERVEGYSNPLWTFLIAFFLLLKVPVWTSAKLLGAVLGLATLPLVWDLSRRARQRDDLYNLLPPLLVASSSQFVIWNASGLENSLFCFLLALAMQRSAAEAEDGGRPWSALAYFLLAITRPEGVAYGLLGLGIQLVGRLRRREPLAVLGWLALYLLPLAAYHAWRYHYFAWPWPNTYYAKMGASTRFRPFDWRVRGWKYLNDYLRTYGVAYAVPLLFFAAAGLRRWRAWVGGALLAGLGVLLLWDGQAHFLAKQDWWRPVARNWVLIRIWWIYGSAVLLGLLILGRRGWIARAVLWAHLVAVFLYVLYTGGDWMKGFRWVNLLSVPLYTALGLGLLELVDLLPPLRLKRLRLRPLLALGAALALAAPNAWGSYDFVLRPETQVRDVARRVTYMSWVQRRLHLDDILLIDVDMGAHLWYSGWRIIDVGGLVDVPVGHHNYERAFIREYMLLENHADFVHSHGGWARRTHLNDFPEFKRRYVEIPGYPVGGRTLHLGNFVAKRHWASDHYAGPDGRRVPFEGGISLDGWELPSPQVPPGGQFFFQTWFRAEGRDAGFRVLVFLADGKGHLVVRETVPGYDWYPVRDWKPGEFIFTGFDLDLPPDLPEGEYRLGLVLLDEETGQVIRPWPAEDEQEGAGEPPTGGAEGREERDEAPAEGPGVPPRLRPLVERAGEETEEPPPLPPEQGELPRLAERQPPHDPLYMEGELLLPARLQVVSREEAHRLAEEDYQRALSLAGSGSCEEAWQAWWDARRHVIRDRRWKGQRDPEVRHAMALCHLSRARDAADDDARAAALVEALRWDHRDDEVLALARPLAQRFVQRGDEAMRAEDWERAYHAFVTAVHLDRRLSWARRKAEYCRDKRLGIRGKGERSFLDSFVDRRKLAKRKKSRELIRSAHLPARSRSKGREKDGEESEEPVKDELRPHPRPPLPALKGPRPGLPFPPPSGQEDGARPEKKGKGGEG